MPLVAQPVPPRSLESVGGGSIGSGEKPRLGIARTVESAVHLTSLGRGSVPINTQLIKVGLAIGVLRHGSATVEIGGIELQPCRSRGADRERAGENSAVPAGNTHVKRVGGGAGDGPVHRRRAVTHARTAASDVDVGRTGIFNIHQEGGAGPKVKALLAVRSVPAVPIDAPLEGDGVAHVQGREGSDGGRG